MRILKLILTTFFISLGLSFGLSLGWNTSVKAHDFKGTAKYLGNEGVLIQSGPSKLMFDPFFHNDYKVYTLVPKAIRQAIFAQTPPYDDIDAIFISHAHEDHFDAKDMLKYLKINQAVKLFAPEQAVSQLRDNPNFKQFSTRIFSISLQKDQAAQSINVEGLQVEAVRIPHAGWPQRAEVENIVFRVGGKEQITVMHLGDADPNITHYEPHKKFFKLKETDIAFPPYWFFLVEGGKAILEDTMNVKESIGVHVPNNAAEALKKSGAAFFNTPGETKTINE